MKEKELIKQFHYLKRIKPDDYWKKNNREILLSQITSTSSLNTQADLKVMRWYQELKNLFIKGRVILVQPVSIVILVIVFVLGGGILSINAARNAKPGDSLYIAKIISERARFNFTFNEEKKARLGLEFATNRTKEITQVLSEPNGSKENMEKVEQLSNDFKEEMKVVKNRLQKINTAKASASKKSTALNSDSAKEKNAAGKSHEIFGANLIKDNKNIDISINKNDIAPQEVTSTPVIATSSVGTDVKIDTGTEQGPVSADEENIKLVDLNKIIEEAENLFNQKDYSGTLNKLAEANTIINNSETGDGNASSSPSAK